MDPASGPGRLSIAQQALRWLTRLALAGLVLASVAAWLAPLGWPFELFVHFRLQLAVAAVLLVPMLWLAQSRVGALMAAAIAALHGLPEAHGLRAAPPVPTCAGTTLDVVAANVEFTNHDPSRLLDWVAKRSPDVVVLEEVTPSWTAALSHVDGYPYVHVLPRNDPYGIALLSRWPLASFATVDLAGDGLASLSVVVQVSGQSVQLYGLHTRWPVLPALARLRDRSFLALAASVRAQRLPTVVVGDLNVTADSPAFARLLAQSGLQDAYAGRGWQPTWSADFWPLALRIDHALVSPSMCVEQAQVGPDIGSDHRPIAVRLRLPTG